MDSTIAAALLTGMLGLVGVLATLWLTQRQSRALLRDQRYADAASERAEREEWYRRSVYESRLRATQEAYTWLARIRVPMSGANPNDQANPETVRLLELCREAREWYDSNAIWLNDGLPTASSFVGFLNKAALFAARPDLSNMGPWDAYIEADRSLRARAEALFAVHLEPMPGPPTN